LQIFRCALFDAYLLKGERKVDRPIHKPEFFKELKMSELIKAVNLFANDLKKYAR